MEEQMEFSFTDQIKSHFDLVFYLCSNWGRFSTKGQVLKLYQKHRINTMDLSIKFFRTSS